MLDARYALACYEENLRGIAAHYFGAQLICPENFPLDRVGVQPIIVVSNHSGMGLSWDNIILDFLLYDQLKTHLEGGERAIAAKPVRLVDPLFLSHGTMALFGITDWWRRIGCVAATIPAFEAAMMARRVVMVSPEGVHGISKGPHRKYQLQPFSTSFLRMAHAHGALVVPVSVVNGEYLNPGNISWTWLNRLGRKLGFPFVPVGISMLQALLPATYLIAAPARLTYVVHEPVDFSSAPKRHLVNFSDEAERFRQVHQGRLDASVRLYHAPYNPKILSSGDPDIARYLQPARWHQLFLKTAGEPGWMAGLYKIPLGYPFIWAARQLLTKNRTNHRL